MKKLAVCAMLVLVASSIGFSQRRNRKAAPAKPKPIIFAVTDDGKTIEPIGVIDKGELKATAGGDSDAKELNAFAGSYYKPKTAYRLIFGGTANGSVTVKNSKTKSECAKNMADVTTVSGKAKLKGVLMALATNEIVSKSASGLRRLPTAAERAEIEALVRTEFEKQNVSPAAAKNFKYHNLTAIDVDHDGKAELVGSFWTTSSATEKNVLFFIADKGADGKYGFGYSEYKKFTPEDVMSGADLTAIDEGIYNELLLDSFAYDGDQSAEIFTMVRGLEGSGFNVYSKRDGKWTKVFEGSNYHCAF